MTDEHETQSSRLADYFAGECTPEEQAELERWMAERPENQALVQGVRHAWHRIQWRPAPAVDVPRMLSRVVGAIEVPSSKLRQRRVVVRNAWYTVAACALGMALFAVVGHTSRLFTPRAAAAPMLRYTTPNGQRANITLPDGSTAALNVASELDVPADYTAGNHTVYLRGEALFDVIHHEGAPFTVMSDGTTTRVLGTSFTVRHYRTDSTVLVAVRTGRVAVAGVVVAANTMVNVSHNQVTPSRPAVPSAFAFATGTLTFENTPLPMALADLDRWYDADIRLGDPALATQRVNGKFAAGSLVELTEILSWTFDVRVVRDGRILTLYPRR